MLQMLHILYLGYVVGGLVISSGEAVGGFQDNPEFQSLSKRNNAPA